MDKNEVNRSVLRSISSNDNDFNTVLTLENASSMELKSGEYGGRYITNDPTSLIASVILFIWCTAQLSNVTTECAF